MASIPMSGTTNHLENKSFFANATRVKRLSLSSLPAGGLRQMGQYIFPSRSLLPNPKDPNIGATLQAVDAEYFRMLLGPKLRSLWLGQDAGGSELYLPYLPGVCPRLESLTTWSWPTDSEAQDIIARLPRLREFTVIQMKLPPLAKTHLSASTLRSLCLSGVSPQYWDLDSTSFPSLTHFTLEECPDLKSIVCFLRALPATTLQDLTLDFPNSAPNIRLVNEAIEVISRFQRLHELWLSGWDSDNFPDGQEIPRYNIEPLLCLRELRAVFIRLGGIGREVIDGIVKKIGTAWPQLNSFGFVQSWYRTMEPAGLTLEALGLFAAHCPRLTSLIIELDATMKPDTPKPAEVSQAAIMLELKGSLIAESSWPWVAKYISAVHPNAQLSIDEDEKMDQGMIGYWKNVISVLPAMSGTK
ncbi:uncharacterized protein PHACADRAFT_169059 [Phanerochaete carnosa HHB-10118-sp]|uniref:F-box domain-containing protein n=1 Tax=Phanerochaete carnosa (strain HHB-10118-sp) TaxID=650164 RepID=K5WQS8_PHACS|nr:uncharacterized protein PHACADRAFT_169059 [Phanerochaete carnosa HHB-10118-sp]EKM61614.1 hypothetical protein PHACADRAFT_169059 [Phanerochaete carnosa HHB-10118-sp]